MRLFIIIALLLSSNTLKAQIFKCERLTGKIIYQDFSCLKSSIQKEIIIQRIDPKITRRAINRLKSELRQRKIDEDLIAQKNKEAKKHEEYTALINAIRNNTYALKRNTELLKKKKQRSRNTYYLKN